MVLDKNSKRPYFVEPWSAAWALEFETIKKQLEDVFGAAALRIEHVGSTSIPGMWAKPTIDALVVVSRMQPFRAERGKMAEVGYGAEDNYIAPDTLLFYKDDETGHRLHNLHVCEKEAPKTAQFLDIRDFLRAHHEWVTKYNTLKEELIRQFPDDYPSYRKGKDDFLRELGQQAEKWKASLHTSENRLQ